MCGLYGADLRILPDVDTALYGSGMLSCVMGTWPYHTERFFVFQALLDVMRLTALHIYVLRPLSALPTVDEKMREII